MGLVFDEKITEKSPDTLHYRYLIIFNLFWTGIKPSNLDTFFISTSTLK